MVFELLNEKLQKIIKKRGFTQPTLPQKLSIPAILEGKNVLLIAPVASGKTEAAILPILHNIMEQKPEPISTLYISPLKSLNRDLLDRIMWWGNELEIEVTVRHGDTTPYQRKLQVEFPNDLMISTLETLQPILTGRKLREILKNIKWIILDEIHETVDSKRGVQLALGLERLRELCQHDFQLIMLSATVGDPEGVANFFSGGRPVQIIKATVPKQMEIKVINPRPEPRDKKAGRKIFTSDQTAARLRTIMELIKDHKSTLTFTNTREFAEILASRIKTLDKDFPAGVHHSSLSKQVRIKTEKEFKTEKIKSIICVTGDSKILLSDGSWKRIEDTCENVHQIVSLNDELKLKKSVCDKIVKICKRKTLKIITKRNFEVETTHDNKFLTIDKTGLKWTEAKNLKKNQPIAVIRRNPFSGEEKKFITILPDDIFVKVSDGLFSEIKQRLSEKYGTYKQTAKSLGIGHHKIRNFLGPKKAHQPLGRLKRIMERINIDIEKLTNNIETVGSRNYHRHKIPLKISPTFVRFVAFLLADGTITRKECIRIFNKNVHLLKKYKNILKKEFNINMKLLDGPDVAIGQGYARWLCRTLENMGVILGRKARIVTIPEIIFGLPLEHKISFLSGYFDGDGNFKTVKNRIYSLSFNTSSKQMAMDLQLLMLSVGIVSSVVYSRKKGNYSVSLLGGVHLRNFIKECRVWKEKTKLTVYGDGYSHQDTIPNVGILLKKLRNKVGASTYFLQKEHFNPYRYEADIRSISRKNLSKLIKIYSSSTRIPELLVKLTSSDIYWDKVKEVKNGGYKDVFDVVDSPSSNFIVNGFISHNCTSSLQLGIDIGSIDLVLQYMSPRQISQLIQRTGRSGHTLKKISKGIIISTEEDDIFESAVIARKALNEEMEPIRFHQNSLDVLAHQLVGLTLERWKVSLEDAYKTVRKVWPYRELAYPEFLEVCKQLERLGLVFLNGHIKKKRRGFQYYFEQLSTIPSLNQYKIFNTVDNSFVGVLDEEFVALHGDVGTTFIVKGEAWRIQDITENKILVEPTEDVEAAVPGWEGELMPVPFEVAEEVGRLRSVIREKLKDNGEKEILAEVQSMYPVDKNCAEKMVDIIKKQSTYGIVPDDKTILVEDYQDLAVLHSCFGTLVNQTLGRFLAALLTARLGSVGLKTDPYRIMIKFQEKNLDLIKEILLETKPEFLKTYLEMSLVNSSLFEWKFVHVAKRFGAISADAQYGRTRMRRIVDEYVGTPIYKETLKELETEKVDIEKATEILKRIQTGEIKIIFKPGLSPLGNLGVKHQYAEVVGPGKPEREIFELFKKRLMGTKVRLVCLNCGKWDRTFTVKEMPEDVKCSKCEARLLAVVHPRDDEVLKIIKKKLTGKSTTAEESKRFKRAKWTAELFLTYRRAVVVALAAKGVGPETATRILAKYHKTEDDLLRDILAAERTWIRTKKYWKV